MKYNDIATIRGRAGFVQDNTMFYVTGGAAAVDTEFGGKVGPASENISDEKWVWGWTAGMIRTIASDTASTTVAAISPSIVSGCS